MIDADEITDMRERALAWATDKYTGLVITRERAIGEDHMALDVLDLVAEVSRLRGLLDVAKDLEVKRVQLLGTHEAEMRRLDVAVAEARAESERMRAALTAIAKHPHQSYEHDGPARSDMDRQYQIGVADGHRCAGNEARLALAAEAKEGNRRE